MISAIPAYWALELECEILTLGSKYPTIRYLPKTIITILNIEHLDTL